MSEAVDTAERNGVPSGAPFLRACAGFFLIGFVLGAWLVVQVDSAWGVAAPQPGGTVTVGQTCTGWTAAVELNHKVSPFRTVNVVSTIPGHPGIVDGTFDSSFGPIWMAAGSEHDVSGTVTLRISAGAAPIFVASATLIPAEGCEPATTTTTTTTTEPSTTTTVAVPIPDESNPAGPVTSQRVTEHPETGANGGLAVGGLMSVVMGAALLWGRGRAR